MISSPGARIIKAVNIAIAVLLAVALAAVYWYLWRPLPQRSGTIHAPVSAAVSVAFDSLGVPHIRAASLEDALFVQGYVTAQDRLWQMDALRRYAAGTLSEVVGPAALESDTESRRFRFRRIAEEAYTQLPAADRAAMAAYTRGVNQFIATHLDRLPIEFRLLGYQPRPWSVVDSILVCLDMFRSLTNTWKDEIAKSAMLDGGDRQKVQFLWPVRTGGEGQPGSNAWALAGARTASGKPLLSNDMHLEYSMPCLWYMMHLEAPGLDVSGVSLPGTPGVIVGHNQRIAWGITNLQFDVQDLYIEQIDERTGRYLYRGQPEQAQLEREFIRVKGRPTTEVNIWITRDGPLFLSEGNRKFALRWVVEQPGLIQYPILDIDRAQNWTQFTAALTRYPGPGANFVYADVDGNIGWHVAGKLPIRRGYDGDVPVDGASGAYGWDGLIPFDQLPSVFNPPDGLIASANQDPFPPDYRYPVNGNFAPPYRVRQIRDLIGARKGWRAADLLAVQKDVYSGFSRFLARQTIAAYDRRKVRDPRLDAAVGLLREWNGQMDQNLAAPLLISLVEDHVHASVADAASPGKAAAWSSRMAPAVIEKLLRERPPGWFRDYDAMLLRALVDGLEDGRRMQGGNPKRWRWGQYLKIPIYHPVTHQVPLIGGYFDIGLVPMSGSGLTVKQTTRILAPSMRLDADLSDWDRSQENITIGQSDEILSRHYRDQWPAYYVGRSFPMQYRSVKASSTLEFRCGAGL